jgi:hypothetical protein
MFEIPYSCMANGEWELSLLLIYESGDEFWELEVSIRLFCSLLKLDNMSKFIFIFRNDREILITTVQNESFYLQTTGAQFRCYVNVYSC